MCELNSSKCAKMNSNNMNASSNSTGKAVQTDNMKELIDEIYLEISVLNRSDFSDDEERFRESSRMNSTGNDNFNLYENLDRVENILYVY